MSRLIDQETIENVKRLHREGVPRKEIARRVWVSLSSVYRILNDQTPNVEFTRVEGDRACTYKLINEEPLKDVLDERGVIGTPVQCQDPPKNLNPFECLNQSIKEITDQAANFASTHKVSKVHLTYDPVDVKDIKYVAPKQKFSVIVKGYVDMIVKSYSPPIPQEFQEGIKARAMNTFRGFNGNLMEMVTKAVHHAVKEAAIRW